MKPLHPGPSSSTTAANTSIIRAMKQFIDFPWSMGPLSMKANLSLNSSAHDRPIPKRIFVIFGIFGTIGLSETSTSTPYSHNSPHFHIHRNPLSLLKKRNQSGKLRNDLKLYTKYFGEPDCFYRERQSESGIAVLDWSRFCCNAFRGNRVEYSSTCGSILICDFHQHENNFGIRPTLFGLDRSTISPDSPL